MSTATLATRPAALSITDERFLAMIKDAIAYGVESDLLEAALAFEDVPAQADADTLDARMRDAASIGDMDSLDALVLESVILEHSHAA